MRENTDGDLKNLVLEWPDDAIVEALLRARAEGIASLRGRQLLGAVVRHERERLEVAVALEHDSPLCMNGLVEHDDATVLTTRRFWLGADGASGRKTDGA